MHNRFFSGLLSVRPVFDSFDDTSLICDDNLQLQLMRLFNSIMCGRGQRKIVEIEIEKR